MADTPRRPLTPDDSLPPVEPPSAAFLVQLFLVPAIIVAIIVCVWLAFHWLAQLGNDPQGYVKTLRRNNEGRWQAALNFANDLRGPGGQALKGDVGLAQELGSILADEVASGRPRAAGHAGEQSKTLCGYLCRALGEFAVPEAAAPLVARAADASDPDTAQAAVEALAVLADNLATAGRSFTDPAAVTAVLLSAAGSDDAAVRSRAAYALGVVGGSGATGRLRALLGDAADNVRAGARRPQRPEGRGPARGRHAVAAARSRGQAGRGPAQGSSARRAHCCHGAGRQARTHFRFAFFSPPGAMTAMAVTTQQTIDLLLESYGMELETVLNYLANSVNLDGVRAEEIKKSLGADVPGEIAHAQQLANRIKQLGGHIPGSKSIGAMLGKQIQPVSVTTDVVGVIKSVIAAEEAACAQYKKIIKAVEGEDYVTQDLCIRLLADEEEHLVQFKGFLKEYAGG